MKAVRLALICTTGLLTVGPLLTRGAADDRVDTNEGAVPADPAELVLPGDGGLALGGVEVLVYTGFLDDGFEKDNMVGVMAGAGANITETSTTNADVLAAELAGKDCFVVPELVDSTFVEAGEPLLLEIQSTFGGFSPVVESFAFAGGVVIVAEGDLSCEPGEAVVDALMASDIEDVQEDTGFATFTIVDAADPLVAGISELTYQNGNMTFSTADRRLEPVATLAGNPDEVLVARKRRFVVIGYDYFGFDAGAAQLLINACQL
ncbi:MAG: hypothetical protein AAF682_29005 [Planctomycetota bacterium]